MHKVTRKIPVFFIERCKRIAAELEVTFHYYTPAPIAANHFDWCKHNSISCEMVLQNNITLLCLGLPWIAVEGLWILEFFLGVFVVEKLRISAKDLIGGWIIGLICVISLSPFIGSKIDGWIHGRRRLLFCGIFVLWTSSLFMTIGVYLFPTRATWLSMSNFVISSMALHMLNIPLRSIASYQLGISQRPHLLFAMFQAMGTLVVFILSNNFDITVIWFVFLCLLTMLIALQSFLCDEKKVRRGCLINGQNSIESQCSGKNLVIVSVAHLIGCFASRLCLLGILVWLKANFLEQRRLVCFGCIWTAVKLTCLD